VTDRIHLGFEIGSGDAVEIPLRNLAVTGQTQESGKTTTLEALVGRGNFSALTFVTKRGEGAFGGGRRVQPYFRDRADWQFVTSIIDATLQEKNKFLRPWIMKICRTTTTLADVQMEIRKALRTAKGLNEGVYTQLDAYLDLIVPEIRRTPLAESLDLAPGLNVMDLSASPTPMQMLFVQSAIDWVNDRETNTVVVIPEAWEFIPEGKGSPVKASATDLVRKGSGIGNRIWVDSQDMAGVDKTILRGCPVWLIGVQREANEIKRNLNNIPKGIAHPTAAQIATLERGQFYACWGQHTVKTYVQPIWMKADEAQEIARGGVRRTQPPKRAITRTEDPTVTEQEAQRLRDENADLHHRVSRLTEQLNELTREGRAESSKQKGAEDAPRSGHRDRGNAGTTPASATSSRNGNDVPFGSTLDLDADAIYAMVKGRLMTEAPGIIKLLTIKPELEVQVQRRTVTADGSTTQGRLARLIAQGFLADTRRFSECLREMERTGLRVNNKSLAVAFKSLIQDGFLTKEGDDGYRAVAGMKVRIVEA
jgi:hypothetical protein